jgi:ribosomal protein L11 methyltransferase
MEQMAAAVEGKIVADIGCGSGVLGIFALLLGAHRVFAIDIDPAALEHARENANINHVEDRLMISTCLTNSDIDVLLLNMTFEEQKKAIAAFPLQLKAKMWITSGILQEQLAVYLSFMEEKGLVIRKVIEKEPWVCCIFST